ncbi:MAG: hypothetical protein IJ272_08115 [Clostridia bacterium]|nr:hypothetical protein [Clostridia bacterium]
MANEENLVDLRTRTTEEQREIARKGGIASGKARAERKKFKDDLITALGAMIDGKTVQEKGIEAIIDKFISGDMQAFTIVRDTIGEKPTDKIEADVGITNINVKLDDEE